MDIYDIMIRVMEYTSEKNRIQQEFYEDLRRVFYDLMHKQLDEMKRTNQLAKMMLH